jgi:hypothetical protein
MYVCMYIHIHVLHMYIYIYVLYIYTHIHIYKYTYIYIYTYLRDTMGRLPKGSLPMIVLGPHSILREHLYGSMLVSLVSSIEKHRGLVSSIDSASTFTAACLLV